MSQKVIILPVKSKDIPPVSKLRQEISLETYTSFNAPKLCQWVRERHSEEQINDEAFGPYQTLMLVGWQADIVVATAYAKIARKRTVVIHT
jgi:hypothetical protein